MHNFYLSRKKRGISTSSLYNYYFFSWRIFVSRIEIYIWANIIWKIPLETSPAGIASPLLSLWCREHLRDDNKAAGENSRNTWEKLRFGRAARQKNSRFSSGNPSEQSLSLSFFFSLLPNYRHSKFSFMTDIHPRRLVSFTSPARCNCFRFETFELYLTSLTSAQSELPTRTLFYAISCQPERMSRLVISMRIDDGSTVFPCTILDRTRKSEFQRRYNRIPWRRSRGPRGAPGSTITDS